jgi:hypothetical protein
VCRGPPHAGPAAVSLGRRRLADAPPRLGAVPLHGAPLEVFEERFLIMMANLLKTVQARFEVVLIERGHRLRAARRSQRTNPGWA